MLFREIEEDESENNNQLKSDYLLFKNECISFGIPDPEGHCIMKQEKKRVYITATDFYGEAILTDYLAKKNQQDC